MNLPHELLEEILSYLQLDCRQDQRNCSLVAKSWTNPSRRLLFRTVIIQETTLRSWLDTISPANEELLQHVRSLYYVSDNVMWYNRKQPAHRIDVLQDYFPSFHRLQNLTLSSMYISSDISQRIEIFSAFRYALSSLSLKHCNITISALVTLINFFSNLNRLNLSRLLHEMDGEPPSSLSRPLIRELYISDPKKDDLGILNQLSELGPVFDKLIIGTWSLSSPRDFSLIADSLGVNARCIRLFRCHECVCAHEYPLKHPLTQTSCSYRPSRWRTHTTLSLPGASGIGVGYDASGES